MGGKESFIEKLGKIAAEYEEKLRPEEWITSRLRWEDWATLQPEAVKYAKKELGRRGHGRAAVLPGGYDAESIAAQAVSDLLEGKGRLRLGWVRSRLVKELERLIRRKIRLLDMLKEASTMSSVLVPDEEGETAHPLADVADGSPDGFEVVVQREKEARREQLRRKVEKFLEDEPELARVFGCQWEGMSNPAVIGRRLGIEEQAVVRARKRLARRLARLRKLMAFES